MAEPHRAAHRTEVDFVGNRVRYRLVSRDAVVNAATIRQIREGVAKWLVETLEPRAGRDAYKPKIDAITRHCARKRNAAERAPR
jgi:hypothetical protein